MLHDQTQRGDQILMKGMHAQGAQIIGSRSGSDSKNVEFCGEKAGRVEVFGCPQRSACDGQSRRDLQRRLSDDHPLNIDCRGRRRDLRNLSRSNCRPATTHLCHLSALSVHGAAACILLATHRSARNACQDRGNCSEHEKNRDETGETTHCCSEYKRWNWISKTRWLQVGG